MRTAPEPERSCDKHPLRLSKSCAVEIYFEDFERHECSENSSELAGRPGATPRLDTGA